MSPKNRDVVRGTLDLMILGILELQAMHGYGIAQRIAQISKGEFNVSNGSFFPALYRLEGKGWVRSAWGASENGRRARYYSLTAAGRRQLTVERRNWDRVSAAISRALRGTV
jgi:transcriptional regulator